MRRSFYPWAVAAGTAMAFWLAPEAPGVAAILGGVVALLILGRVEDVLAALRETRP